MKIPHAAIHEAFDLLPRKMDGRLARIYLIAIGLQESRFDSRYQIVGKDRSVKGPARGFWQFELGGGALGVVTHRASKFWLQAICADRGVPFSSTGIYARIETDDTMAAICARLLLWTDPKPLIDNEADAWLYYLRVWRPGKPHSQTWPHWWETAKEVVDASY